MSSSGPSTPSTGPATSSQTPHSGPAPTPANSSSQNLQSLPYEDRLPKIWRHLVSSMANSLHKAEKAGADSSQENCRELNDSVVTFLRTRMEYHRILGNVEAKLQGREQEREALEGYVRTQPKLGKRKRKQEDLAAAELQSEIQKVADATTEMTASGAPTS
eukprot:CAMPEP_0176008928 /NCGR_PEP_ID=MMETSP0120_2-20121206/3991_1 /TAXON_ID=160619 /ORGANISM="Kryptoperidinium foliaceum, Strain CCMP 1326" /LENGTH=160 /DNA_ID=CAMNT_0017341715 /DNA_START=130 /DNA_END=612 /DNA_ORIENTATION=+